MRGVISIILLVVTLRLLGAQADIIQTTITPESYITIGNSTITKDYIVITLLANSQAGIALYSTQQTVGSGFSAVFTYAGDDDCYFGGYGYVVDRNIIF